MAQYLVAPVTGTACLGYVVCGDGLTFGVHLVIGAHWRSIGGDLEDARHDGYRLAYGERPTTWRSATDSEVTAIQAELEEEDLRYVNCELASQREA